MARFLNSLLKCSFSVRSVLVILFKIVTYIICLLILLSFVFPTGVKAMQGRNFGPLFKDVS